MSSLLSLFEQRAARTPCNKLRVYCNANNECACLCVWDECMCACACVCVCGTVCGFSTYAYVRVDVCLRRFIFVVLTCVIVRACVCTRVGTYVCVRVPTCTCVCACM